ncbi:hypothetical protein ACQKML_23950 [Peribacillus frigoritolerans]
MPLFISQFYLASNPDKRWKPLKEHEFSLSSHHIGNLGELYSGTLIRHLGQHYGLYTNPSTSPISWHVHNTSFGIKVGRIEFQNEKQRAQAISGNIGEVLVIPGLASTLKTPMNKLNFHRIKAQQMKCPDYRISLSSSDLNKLWPSKAIPTIVVPDLPLEVKSCLKEDNYYPVEALQQLYEYWKECNNPLIEGYGLIARINIAEPYTYIRYYLFFKNNRFTMGRFKKAAYAQGLRKSLSGVKKSKQQRIVETVGGLFF